MSGRMSKMVLIPVFEDGKVIAQVEENNNLDFWDGRNYTSGSTGRHLGYTRLQSGKWVLIHGTQWQGERASAEVVSAEDLIQAAAKTNHLDEIFETYPELSESGFLDKEVTASEPELFEGDIVPFGNGAHVVIPGKYIGMKIKYKIIRS